MLGNKPSSSTKTINLKDLIPVSEVLVHHRDLSQIKNWARLGSFTPFNDNEIFRMVNSIEYYRVLLERIKNTQAIPNGEIEQLLNKEVIYKRN